VAHIPSNEEIPQLLERLENATADDLESEVLEFQSWDEKDQKTNLQHAVECAVAFANASGGVIVFGVKDRERGRRDAITGCGKCEAQRWQQQIYESTSPSLHCAVDEIDVPEGTLIAVHVPAQPPGRRYGTTQGLFKVRVGKSNQPLDSAAFGELREAPLSDEEQTLIRAAGERNGDIYRIETDQTGPFVRIMTAQDLYDVEDPAARARFLDALESVVRRGHVRHIDGQHYSLTGSGWEAARGLGAADGQTREDIRKLADPLYIRERERMEPEARRRFEALLRDLDRRNLEGTTAAREICGCILDTIRGLAEIRKTIELQVLADAGVTLDRRRADALKADISRVVNKATEQCTAWLPDRWLAKLDNLAPRMLDAIRSEARKVETESHRDIEIALKTDLLKSRKPKD
jgi:hypothetical protein